MNSFYLNFTSDGHLSIVCPKCGSTDVDTIDYPSEVHKIKCTSCDYTLNRLSPPSKSYHQITIDELLEKNNEVNHEI